MADRFIAEFPSPHGVPSDRRLHPTTSLSEGVVRQQNRQLDFRDGSMLLKKSVSTADQNFSWPLMRFSDKYVRDLRLLMKKLTGDFANGLGAELIGEDSLASFL
jgi:hypothetical protein